MTNLKENFNKSIKNFDKVIVRFAPSPTGRLHVGNTRTALINQLFYHSSLQKNANNSNFIQNSRFILRIDDTDKVRSKREYEEEIMADLQWLGIQWTAFYRQSERMDLYKNAMEKLIANGRLYPCYESKIELDLMKKQLLSNNQPPIYDRRSLNLSAAQKQELEAQGMRPHWRFKLLNEDITWHDRVRGLMQFKGASLSDPILIKETGEMTYTLASVVDDIEMGVTDIIRGEDHLSNSATHIQIFEALGAPHIPNFAHLSLLYNKDQEISKRLGGFEIAKLREIGIEPMAIRGFFSKIGSSDSVKLTYDNAELEKEFDFAKFSRSSVHYDFKELELFNSKLIQNMPYNEAQSKIISALKADTHQISQNLQTNAISMTQDLTLFWQVIRANIENFHELPFWYGICFSRGADWHIFQEKIPEIAQFHSNNHYATQENHIAFPNVEAISKNEEKSKDIEFCASLLQFLPENTWDNSIFDQWISNVKAAGATQGRKGKELFLPIRRLLTGLSKGPDLGGIMLLLGRAEVISRLSKQ
jgi:glutamyl-tRNA synthetase